MVESTQSEGGGVGDGGGGGATAGEEDDEDDPPPQAQHMSWEVKSSSSYMVPHHPGLVRYSAQPSLAMSTAPLSVSAQDEGDGWGEGDGIT